MKCLGLILLLASSPSFADGVTETAAPAGDFESIKARLESLEQGAKSESNRWRIEGYTQLRYDDQQYKIATINAPNSATPTVFTSNNNVRGGYIKKFEVKTSGEVAKNFNWVAGVDFAEGKLKDLGTIWSGLPLVPFAIEDYTWTLKVGQFRQPFGIEPQTGTPGLAFNERSLINGGSNPLNLSPAVDLKLIGERVLGLQAWQKHSFDKCGYEIGMALSNDGTDQAKGSNTLALGFPAQLTDENPTFTTRVGLFCGYGGQHKLGVSYQHNPKDSAFMATTTAGSIVDETLGLDWRSEFGKVGFLQAEWLGQNAGISGLSGLGSRREGWYAEGGLNFLGLFVPQTKDKLELLARCEHVNMDIHNAVYSPNIGAGTVGLKWTYGKNSQTSMNYTCYGIDGNPSAAGNVNLLSIQDLITF